VNPMIEISIKAWADLTDQDRIAWTALRTQNTHLYSPYFDIAYSDLIDKLCGDVRVIHVAKKGLAIGFLPFQGSVNFARPVGAPMTDYHGFICSAQPEFLAKEALQTAGIGTFHFGGLIDPTNAIKGPMQTTMDCTMMDISATAEQWRMLRDGSYRRSLKSLRRRIRKSEEEFGTPRTILCSHDLDVFNTLIQWKRQKFRETGKYDVLSVDWTFNLIKTLWQDGFNGLRCDMHGLYFGDRLAAIDLGLTDGPTFHSWIVAYDSALHNLSPGIQLLESLIDNATDLGYSRIDLGAGTEGYKRHYATDAIAIKTGFTALNGPAGTLSGLYGAAERIGRKSLADAPGKLRRRYSQIAACDDSFSGRAKAMFAAMKTAGRNG